MMYDTIRDLIERKRFKSFDALKKKLVVYNAADLITDEETAWLLAYGREVYGND